MTSKYNDIYSCFLSKITDYKFVSLPADDAYELMNGWLHSAVSKPYIRRIFSSLALDDEVATITFEVLDAVDDNYDKEYAMEIISKGMVIEWLEPQVKSTLSVAQMFSGKEAKWYSEANHLKEIKGLLEDAKCEIRKIIRDHGYFYRNYISNEA